MSDRDDDHLLTSTNVGNIIETTAKILNEKFDHMLSDSSFENASCNNSALVMGQIMIDHHPFQTEQRAGKTLIKTSNI